MAGQTDLRNIFKITLPHPSYSNQTWTARFTFKPALHGPVVHFFLVLSFLMLNTHDQTIKVSIAPPAHPTCRHSHPSEDLADIVLSDANPESDEDITIISFRLAPGPSGSAMAIPLCDASEDSDIIEISESKPESDADSEDVAVSLFPLLYFSLVSNRQNSQTQGR